jgi:hypothetical protein
MAALPSPSELAREVNKVFTDLWPSSVPRGHWKPKAPMPDAAAMPTDSNVFPSMWVVTRDAALKKVAAKYKVSVDDVFAGMRSEIKNTDVWDLEREPVKTTTVKALLDGLSDDERILLNGELGTNAVLTEGMSPVEAYAALEEVENSPNRRGVYWNDRDAQQRADQEVADRKALGKRLRAELLPTVVEYEADRIAVKHGVYQGPVNTESVARFGVHSDVTSVSTGSGFVVGVFDDSKAVEAATRSLKAKGGLTPAIAKKSVSATGPYKIWRSKMNPESGWFVVNQDAMTYFDRDHPDTNRMGGFPTRAAAQAAVDRLNAKALVTGVVPEAQWMPNNLFVRYMAQGVPYSVIRPQDLKAAGLPADTDLSLTYDEATEEQRSRLKPALAAALKGISKEPERMAPVIDLFLKGLEEELGVSGDALRYHLLNATASGEIPYGVEPILEKGLTPGYTPANTAVERPEPVKPSKPELPRTVTAGNVELKLVDGDYQYEWEQWTGPQNTQGKYVVERVGEKFRLKTPNGGTAMFDTPLDAADHIDKTFAAGPDTRPYTLSNGHRLVWSNNLERWAKVDSDGKLIGVLSEDFTERAKAVELSETVIKNTKNSKKLSRPFDTKWTRSIDIARKFYDEHPPSPEVMEWFEKKAAEAVPNPQSAAPEPAASEPLDPAEEIAARKAAAISDEVAKIVAALPEKHTGPVQFRDVQITRTDGTKSKVQELVDRNGNVVYELGSRTGDRPEVLARAVNAELGHDLGRVKLPPSYTWTDENGETVARVQKFPQGYELLRDGEKSGTGRFMPTLKDARAAAVEHVSGTSAAPEPAAATTGTPVEPAATAAEPVAAQPVATPGDGPKVDVLRYDVLRGGSSRKDTNGGGSFTFEPQGYVLVTHGDGPTVLVQPNGVEFLDRESAEKAAEQVRAGDTAGVSTRSMDQKMFQNLVSVYGHPDQTFVDFGQGTLDNKQVKKWAESVGVPADWLTEELTARRNIAKGISSPLVVKTDADGNRAAVAPRGRFNEGEAWNPEHHAIVGIYPAFVTEIEPGKFVGVYTGSNKIVLGVNGEPFASRQKANDGLYEATSDMNTAIQEGSSATRANAMSKIPTEGNHWSSRPMTYDEFKMMADALGKPDDILSDTAEAWGVPASYGAALQAEREAGTSKPVAEDAVPEREWVLNGSEGDWRLSGGELLAPKTVNGELKYPHFANSERGLPEFAPVSEWGDRPTQIPPTGRYGRIERNVPLEDQFAYDDPEQRTFDDQKGATGATGATPVEPSAPAAPSNQAVPPFRIEYLEGIWSEDVKDPDNWHVVDSENKLMGSYGTEQSAQAFLDKDNQQVADGKPVVRLAGGSNPHPTTERLSAEFDRLYAEKQGTVEPPAGAPPVEPPPTEPPVTEPPPGPRYEVVKSHYGSGWDIVDAETGGGYGSPGPSFQFKSKPAAEKALATIMGDGGDREPVLREWAAKFPEIQTWWDDNHSAEKMGPVAAATKLANDGVPYEFISYLEESTKEGMEATGRASVGMEAVDRRPGNDQAFADRGFATMSDLERMVEEESGVQIGRRAVPPVAEPAPAEPAGPVTDPVIEPQQPAGSYRLVRDGGVFHIEDTAGNRVLSNLGKGEARTFLKDLNSGKTPPPPPNSATPPPNQGNMGQLGPGEPVMPSFDPSKLDTAAKVFNKAMHPGTPPAEAAVAAARYESLKAKYGFTDADVTDHINRNTPPPRGAGTRPPGGGASGGGTTPPPGSGGGGAGGGTPPPPPPGAGTPPPGGGPFGADWARRVRDAYARSTAGGGTPPPGGGASSGASAAAGAASAGARGGTPPGGGIPFDPTGTGFTRGAPTGGTGATAGATGATAGATGSMWSRFRTAGGRGGPSGTAPAWMRAVPFQNSSMPRLAQFGRFGVGMAAPIAAGFAGDAIDRSQLLGGADSAANNAVSAALRGAGLGASAGMFFGLPWLGAGLGAAAGAGISLLNRGDGGDDNWMTKLAAMRDQYGVDPADYQDIIENYNLTLDLADDPNDPEVMDRAKQKAKQDFLLAAQGAYEPTMGGSFGKAGDALAMQALIGNYVKPYMDMTASAGNDVAAAYENAANQIGDPGLAGLARAAGQYNRQRAVQAAGEFMGATMVDPQLLAAQRQAKLLQGVTNVRQSDPLAGL